MNQEIVYITLAKFNLFNKPLKEILVKLKKKTNLSDIQISSAISSLKKEKRISVSPTTITNRSKLFIATVKSNINGAYAYCYADGKKYPIQDKTVKDGDRVELGISRVGSKDYAFVTKFVTDKITDIVGEIHYINNQFIFVPDDVSIKMPISLKNDDYSNYLNKKLIIKHSSENPQEFEIDQVIGDSGDPITENIAIAKSFDFNKYFDGTIIDEVEKFTELTSEDYFDRLDLTSKKFVTIDPSTCKDMDDAVFVEKKADGYKVYVAIADVSHYVKKDSKCNAEAYKRGTSCYLGSDVYPMLHQKLSNDLCSLNENKVRPVLCAIIDIDDKGEMKHYEVKKALIKSCHKLSYETTEDIYLCANGKDKIYNDIKPNIDLMYEISDKLEFINDKNGKLNFDRREPVFIFSPDRKTVLDIKSDSDVKSHGIIENFMILANVAVAKFCQDNKINVPYRVHESPMGGAIIGLNATLKHFGVTGSFSASNSGYQRMLKAIKSNKNSDYLSFIILKTLPKAKYYSENLSHFGLGLSDYLHFTSPIRRYPDTVIHQAISYFLQTSKNLYTEEEIIDIAFQSSTRERMAAQAEALSNKLLYSVWAGNHLEEVFEGRIYMQLNNGYIVKIKDHIEVFVPDKALLLNAERKYACGNKILIKLTNIDHNFNISAIEVSKSLGKSQEDDIVIE